MDKFITLPSNIEGLYKDADGNSCYRLTYDFNKVVEAEEACGCSLLRALAGPSSAKEMRALLYALLKTGHPEVTLEEAGSLFTSDPVGATDAVRRCLDGETSEA